MKLITNLILFIFTFAIIFVKCQEPCYDYEPNSCKELCKGQQFSEYKSCTVTHDSTFTHAWDCQYVNATCKCQTNEYGDIRCML